MSSEETARRTVDADIPRHSTNSDDETKLGSGHGPTLQPTLLRGGVHVQAASTTLSTHKCVPSTAHSSHPNHHHHHHPLPMRPVLGTGNLSQALNETLNLVLVSASPRLCVLTIFDFKLSRLRRHSHFTIPSYRRSITNTNALPDRRLSLNLNLAPPLPPPNFSPEDQAYLQARLPIRQPASAATAADHFRRLPSLYQDLAEGCRARLSRLPAGGREWARRRRMADLAQRLAERYRRFRLVLPRSYVDEAIARWRGEQPRASRFWEKVLDEVEKANSAWSIVRLWIMLFVVQSTLVALAFRHIIPGSASTGLGLGLGGGSGSGSGSAAAATAAQVALLAANALAYTWSTTVMGEMLHARYMDGKAEEQELHDLLGGLRG
ncbi:NADH-cytochrome b5 reductase [Purpureocillium lavendulum]|uniref:NADH-cytochrome b5 reductase n=1 Tax=Purpureocillium lavendulum TaxID=1247861 RepID=A0AB34FVA2_9HYPO|nr:NADH-cytochrome b5 reductase [Purpureocillium lavendulum]